MNIRPMEIFELESMLELYVNGLCRELSQVGEILRGRVFDPSGMANLKKLLLPMLRNLEAMIFVCEVDGKFIAYSLATKKLYPAESPSLVGCINGIFVLPESRKMGIGLKVLQRAEEWLRSQGVDYVELYYNINADDAREFWKKTGYLDVQVCAAKRI